MCAILACVLTFDLFTHPDRSITFDGRVHITTISMYHDLLAQHQFPIVWADKWGNYGFPLGLVSFQTTSYLGGLIQFLVKSPVMAYDLVLWLATFGSALLMYIWLRGHVKLPAALAATVLFVFAPYHLQNIYVRGALPEYAASVFILLVLVGIQHVLTKSKSLGYLWIVFGVALLSLTHPMMLVTGALFCGLYALLLCITAKQKPTKLIWLGLVALLGLMLAGYYILPLLVEIKYFYYGVGDKLRQSGFLSVEGLLSPFAPYFGSTHPGPPGDSLRLGVFESFALGVGTVLIFLKAKKVNPFFIGLLVITLLLSALTLPVATPLFTHISFLNALQYPWRFLSVISIAIPLLVAILLDAYVNVSLFCALILLILAARVPQAYGKDYILTPPEEYRFTVTNLHTKNMAPVWAGESADYPVHPGKVAIIEGEGILSNVRLANSERDFNLAAKTTVRMADYTFYFPGWQVLVDGVQTPLEFQDPHYRGVITYKVPPGNHSVSVRFTPTRIRKVSWGVTGLAVLIGAGIWARPFFQKKRMQKLKRIFVQGI